MRTKRILSLVLTVFMAVAMLAGCGNQNGNTDNKEQDGRISISMCIKKDSRHSHPGSGARLQSLSIRALWRRYAMGMQHLQKNLLTNIFVMHIKIW